MQSYSIGPRLEAYGKDCGGVVALVRQRPRSHGVEVQEASQLKLHTHSVAVMNQAHSDSCTIDTWAWDVRSTSATGTLWSARLLSTAVVHGGTPKVDEELPFDAVHHVKLTSTDHVMMYMKRFGVRLSPYRPPRPAACLDRHECTVFDATDHIIVIYVKYVLHVRCFGSPRSPCCPFEL